MILATLVLTPFIKLTFARESLEFKVGDKINVLSDKALRKTKDNYIEASGNVIITHKDKSIYGEKASLAMTTGMASVVGNVRYVGPQMTLYGSEIDYNFFTSNLEVKNARLVSGDNFVVHGKLMARDAQGIITARDAEYTTCKDCPESWSIFGKYVHITIGEYIRITHAFIKIRGVVVMYFPYVVFPIKRKRSTGLLFPNFSFSSDNGFTYLQPWFWAIGDSSDITLTPSVWGRRGYGGEFQGRQMLGDSKWFEVNALNVWDKIYDRNKSTFEKSGHTTERFMGDYEHHFQFGNNFSHHLYYSEVNDLDIIRDFSNFSNPKVIGSEIGGESHFDWRTSLFNISMENDFHKNQIVKDAKSFDHSYVQTLPEVNLDFVPVTILKTNIPLLQSLSIGAHFDYTVFKQDRVKEKEYLRNAQRLNAVPYVDWRIGQFGPITAKTSAKFDQQYYSFRTPNEKSLAKQGVVYESELSMGLIKHWGLAYQEIIPVERLDWKKYQDLTNEEKIKSLKKDEERNEKLIGNIPSISNELASDTVTVVRNGHSHIQNFKLKHYYISSQIARGNDRFLSQIRKDEGQFDTVDSIRSKEYETGALTARRDVPLSNTIEFQWNNSLVRKSPRKFDPFNDGRFLQDNFDYSRISYFDLSQGLDLNVKSSQFQDQLTRLKIDTGITFQRFSFSATEYYYYITNGHDTTLTTSMTFPSFKWDHSFRYDSFSAPPNQFYSTSITYVPIDQISLSGGLTYNLAIEQLISNYYTATYRPKNNCWRMEVGQWRNQEERRFAVNFYINYNNNAFVPLIGL